MQVVGVDFGTSNVRIATWDSEGDLTPSPLMIGQEGQSTMPAVIAFQRRAGEITSVVGEVADDLADDNDTVVVRNIKRWALASDDFVRWRLDASNTEPEPWWNPETRCVKAFGDEFPVWDVIRQILAEAFRRAKQAGLNGEFEWRAGCPVQADLEYRSELAAALAEFGGESRVSWVVEEPVLFLALARRLGALDPGSYLVYDLGGGSFDCALAEVEANGQMTVYASSGDPLVGGSTIDWLLAKQLDYHDSAYLLRLAKEQLAPSSPVQDIGGMVVLHWSDLEDVLNKFQFIGKTQAAMREAYISAKVIWKWDDSTPTLGGSSIPSLKLGKMAEAFARDLDGIILFGGPTRSELFRQRLGEIFGAEMLKAAEDLIPAEIPDPELTGLSVGACYAYSESSSPLYVRRLPARITLRNTRTGRSVSYEPYQHFVPNFSPALPFVSERLPQANLGARYELTITDPDSEPITSRRVDSDGSGGRRSGTEPPRLVIDTLGRVGIDDGEFRWVIPDPPWQTNHQRSVLRAIIKDQDELAQREQDRVRRLLTGPPFGYGPGNT